VRREQTAQTIQTVIMAGGKGTRVASIASDIPKPMIPVLGKPILQYQIENLARNGLRDIIIVTGHLGGKIREYFGDGGWDGGGGNNDKDFGVHISYYNETEALGTAGALFKIKDRLRDDFLLLCGDIIFDIDFKRMIDFYHAKNALAVLAAHPNSHPFDSALLVTGDNDRVTQWLTKEDPRLWYKNQVNAGVHIINKALLDIAPEINPEIRAKEKIDLDRDILKPALFTNRIFAYRTPEYIKDMGTPERYRQVARDLENGFVHRRNLSAKQWAVFLDRDGTINQTNGFVRKPDDFHLIKGAAEAIRRINDSGALAILITNQPVIARGEISLDGLRDIHNKMEAELGKDGAYLDDIFFCPHHPDSGFPGERPEYKIECSCRKPKPGMLLAAAQKYNIDLAASFMIGDSWRDVEAGINAGCTPIFISDKPYIDLNGDAAAVRTFPSLQEAVEWVCGPRSRPGWS